MFSFLGHALRRRREILQMSRDVNDVTGKKTVFNVVGFVTVASAVTASMEGLVGAGVREDALREFLERSKLLGFLDESIEALPPEADLQAANAILSSRLGDYKARYGNRAREAIDEIVESMHWEARRRGGLVGAYTFEHYLDRVTTSNGAAFLLQGCAQVVHATDDVPQYKGLFADIDRALRLTTDMAKVWKDLDSRENVLLQYMDLSPSTVSLEEAVQTMKRRYQRVASGIVARLASCSSDPECSPPVLACAESFWKNAVFCLELPGKVFHLFRVRNVVSGMWSGTRAWLKPRI